MRQTYFLTVVYLATAIVPGCSKQEERATPIPHEQTTSETVGQGKTDAVEISSDLRAQIEAKLAEADKLDGAEDKMVRRCASCALGMDGKSEHSLEVSGYTLHFCTSHCKEGFAQNVSKSVLSLKIPEN